MILQLNYKKVISYYSAIDKLTFEMLNNTLDLEVARLYSHNNKISKGCNVTEFRTGWLTLLELHEK